MPSGVNATGFAPGAYEKMCDSQGEGNTVKPEQERTRETNEREREREREEGVLTKSNESLNSGR